MAKLSQMSTTRTVEMCHFDEAKRHSKSTVRMFDEAKTTFEMGVVLHIIYSLLLLDASS